LNCFIDEVVHILIPDRHKAHKWVKVTLESYFAHYRNREIIITLVVIIYYNWFANRHAAIRPVIAS